MKRILVTIICLCLLISTLYGCSSKEQNDDELTIYIASDIHYLDKSLYDNGEFFTEMMDNADGKMTSKSEEIVDELIARTIKDKPDALILAGDLTFNGELKSLKSLCKKLKKVKKAGIPVLIIPGNHDIDYPYAMEYKDNEANPVSQITKEDYLKIAGELGYNDSISKAEDSFSYYYKLADDFGIMLLDCNTTACPSQVSNDTIDWATSVLENNDDKIISVTHQNVLPQNDMMATGYVMINHFAIERLLNKNNISNNFSGHTHIQHERSRDNLTDVAVGSLSVSPLRFDIITVDKDRNVSYELDNLDILQDEAKEYFKYTNNKKLDSAFEGLQLDKSTENEMREWALDINHHIYSGTLDDESKQEFLNSNGYKLWEKHSKESFWFKYLDDILRQK